MGRRVLAIILTEGEGWLMVQWTLLSLDFISSNICSMQVISTNTSTSRFGLALLVEPFVKKFFHTIKQDLYFDTLL
jgi:hypothetical protein